MKYDDFVSDNIRSFIRSTGKQPIYIYVGTQEFQQLMNSELMQFNERYYDKETQLYGCRFFMGLKVMQVMQSTHFNIT